MTQYFDADGNPVEGLLTPEEVAAKIEEEKSKIVTPPVVTPPVVTSSPDEPPAWAKSLIDKVENLSGNQRATIMGDIVGRLDADKKTEFDTHFNRLSGYEETPEGIQSRAQAAYLLTTGQQYDAGAINMQNIAASGGGPVRPTVNNTTETDKAIQSALGITEVDVTKHATK